MDALPFRAEYAKSNRSGCKSCKENIPQESLRLARLVQSTKFDGTVPYWFHYDCFFQKQRPKSTSEIEFFEKLRYEDQQKIQRSIAANSGGVEPTTAKSSKAKAKGKKRSAEEPTSSSSALLKDFGVEYAASGRALCKGCEIKILKDEVRIKKIVYDTEVGMKYGGQPLWHHVDCFSKLRDELEFYESGEKLPGYSYLREEDRKLVKDSIPAMKKGEISAKKMKSEPKDEVDLARETMLEEKIKKQNKKMFEYRDYLKGSLKKGEWIDILELNRSFVPEGNDAILERVADFMTFGALAKCKKCKHGDLAFKTNNYVCIGNLTEWVKCTNTETSPARQECKIPSYLKEKFSFLKKFKSNLEERAVRPSTQPPINLLKVKKEDNDNAQEPRIKKQKPPLYEMHFVLLGKSTAPKEAIKERIVKMGGKLVTKIHDRIMAVISNESEVKKLGSRMSEVKELGIQVVPENFLDEVEKTGDAIEKIKSMNLADWGNDPLMRVQKEEEQKKQKDRYLKNVPDKVTLKLKGGIAVDPDSGLEDIAHVYKQGKEVYTAVLGLTDIQKNKNSYYKMQVLQSDKGSRCWFFRSWGRIGTNIGDHKLEMMSDIEDAIEQFEHFYLDKTANHWHQRANFKKRPDKMYPIDVDYDDMEEKTRKLQEHSDYKSKLSQQVQDLVKMLFDIENMKKTMMSFELDMEKMPLGKLSKKQMENAHKVLSELSVLITNGGSNEQFIDASNRFYTLIPHTFGIHSVPILDTVQMIKDKTDMLDSLLEIEVAYSMLNAEIEGEINPIDAHYEQLKTAIEPLDHKSEEFMLIQKYVKNTHAKTHNAYDLEVQDVFKIKRQGEDRRYKPFKKLHNRQLLWHGSRLTNYAGILSHGLKIAPPEAPPSGYMFGKGIYFADMVSKSANYCCTSPDNSTGLMLLCEVALGDMYELTRAKYINQLPVGNHSTKGIGKTCPDPTEAVKRSDGVVIPTGKPITDDKLKSDLLYNEYIVYDISQVNVQYLLKMKFKYRK